MVVQPLRKIEQPERKFTVIHGKKSSEARLPLTIKMFVSCSAAAFGFVLVQSASDADATTRAVVGVLVSLVGTLAFLVYRDVTRRLKDNDDAIKELKDTAIRDLDHKIDKAIRAFTGILVATHPDKASEIYRVSEAFFKEE